MLLSKLFIELLFKYAFIENLVRHATIGPKTQEDRYFVFNISARTTFRANLFASNLGFISSRFSNIATPWLFSMSAIDAFSSVIFDFSTKSPRTDSARRLLATTKDIPRQSDAYFEFHASISETSASSQNTSSQ